MFRWSALSRKSLHTPSATALLLLLIACDRQSADHLAGERRPASGRAVKAEPPDRDAAEELAALDHALGKDPVAVEREATSLAGRAGDSGRGLLAGQATLRKAQAQWEQSKHGDSASSFETAIAALRRERATAAELSQAHYGLSGALRELGDADDAVRHAIEAVEQARRAEDAHLLGSALSQLAQAQGRNGDQAAMLAMNAQARIAFERAYAERPTTETEGALIMAIYNQGSAELLANRLTDAERSYVEAERRSRTFHDPTFRPNVLIGLGELHSKQGRHALAIRELLSATASLAPAGGPSLGYAQLGLSKALRRAGQAEEAVALASRVVTAATIGPTASPAMAARAHEDLATALVAAGRPAEAAAEFRRALDASRAVFDKERSDAVVNAQARFDLRERAAENAALLQRQEIQRLEISRQRWALGAGAALVLGLLAAAGLLWRSRREERRARALLQARNGLIEAQRADLERANRKLDEAFQARGVLLREIDHRVNNNLHTIGSLLKLQINRMQGASPATGGAAALREFLTRIEALSLVHRSLSRTRRRAEVSMPGYLGDMGRYLFELFGSDASLETSVADVSYPIRLANPLGLIVCELIANALEHGDLRAGDHVFVRLEDDGQGRAVLTVADTGRGLPDEWDAATASSLGLSLVRSLARELRAELRHERGPDGRGAVWSLSFATDRVRADPAAPELEAA